jgi:type II restriction enzyme
MPTQSCFDAIEACLKNGQALFKFITPNDVGLTGGHQYGFLLPKAKDVWRLFTSIEPQKGKVEKQEVSITWPNGLQTDSAITWYGDKTRREYRLTKFGKQFPFRAKEMVGDLLVLVPYSYAEMAAFVLSYDEDLEELEAALGITLDGRWAAYRAAGANLPDATNVDEIGYSSTLSSESLRVREATPRTPEDCLQARFIAFSEQAEYFPEGRVLAEYARASIEKCVKNFKSLKPDEQLLLCMETEFTLFKSVETRICTEAVRQEFDTIDAFLKLAQTMTQRRKARAGKSLENHVQFLLEQHQLPHVAQPPIDGEPDVIFPGVHAYNDPSFPDEALVMLGIKTTCKDRWRQVLNEAKRCKNKFLLTLQKGISAPQLEQMREAGVTLVVPHSLHDMYPPGAREGVVISVASFIQTVRSTVIV